MKGEKEMININESDLYEPEDVAMYVLAREKLHRRWHAEEISMSQMYPKQEHSKEIEEEA